MQMFFVIKLRVGSVPVFYVSSSIPLGVQRAHWSFPVTVGCTRVSQDILNLTNLVQFHYHLSVLHNSSETDRLEST